MQSQANRKLHSLTRPKSPAAHIRLKLGPHQYSIFTLYNNDFTMLVLTVLMGLTPFQNLKIAKESAYVRT